MRNALANLPFGAKIGGGFALVVALSVILGLSGTFAIMTLNERMGLTARTTGIITQLQKVSASREVFLKSRDAAAAVTVQDNVDALQRQLGDMRDMAQTQEVQSLLTSAMGSVDGLKSNFVDVTGNLEQQAEQLAALLAASTRLEGAAKSINTAVEAEREASSTQLLENTSLLTKADALGREITQLLDDAKSIQSRFAASTSGPELVETIALAKTLADATGALAADALNDTQRGEIDGVASQAAALAAKLEELATTTDFMKLFGLRSAVKDLAAAAVEQVGAQRARTYAIADDIRATTRALGAQQASISKLASDSVAFINQTLDAKSETFAYLGDLQGHEAERVAAAIDALSVSANTLKSDGKAIESLAEATNSIDGVIADYRQVFDGMVATRQALAEKQLALDKLSGAVSTGISSIAATEGAAAAAAGDAALLRIAVVLIAAISLSCAIAFFLARAISRPVRALTATMERLAQGDTELEIAGTQRGDEIGGMSRAVQVFRDNAIDRRRLAENQQREQDAEAARQTRVTTLITGFRSTIQDLLSSVSGSVSDMEKTAGTLSEIATQAAAQTSEAADASELANANVQTVASAAEELSSSIQEISRQVGQTTEIVSTATTGAKETNAKVSSLAAAANKIGEVISLIQDIAEQTNLLALNATIEAARAGEMGKGFAVVASEVKVLATQTSRATEEIGAQVAAIQASTSDAVDAIGAITATMDEVNQYTGAIAAAVEQQGAATGEISRSVQDATRGTTSVSQNMKTLADAVAQTSSSVTTVHSATTDVSRKTEDLRSEIDRFLREVTAA
ncbi:HAMP domain-containing methyl-accepting chemotaxis protein [Breoghania sp. L-A4]|uniref:methyl-accepting chemotaxis protein n=1 Tax=Breoghania sp. L-A4 TaxID=2304600 RepID=UPI0013C3347D|nr:HAMP domain-containing methyl-accepting chemotaxis protein [Breoghania sp. L-A4]